MIKFIRANWDHAVMSLLLQLAFFAGGFGELWQCGVLASFGYFMREHAQNEYWLEQLKGYDPHKFWEFQWVRAWNPFEWPQKWDFFVPLIVISLVSFTGWLIQQEVL